MNIALVVAAFLCFAIGILHSYLGEKYVVRRLTALNVKLRGDVAFMRQVIWFAWHLTTLLFWGFGAVLLNMSMGTAAPTSAKSIVAWTFVAAAVLSLVGTRARHLSWIVFAAIAALVFIAGPAY